ncbi:MAG: 26S proteasome regulatory subunit rpn6 [Cyphobasidiales sp. Tagirdzhanova-0007]|nr:MAG: 26S proteasome regulatory subunit rpn6 [Cyphobasidiales sp. Tagirdzhanova-0007]
MSIPSTSSPAATPAVNGVGTVNGATKRSEEDLKAILGAATGEQRIQNDNPSDDIALRQKESALVELGEFYRDQKNAAALSDVVLSSRSFMSTIAKAKTAKLIRTLIDFFSSIPDSRDTQIKVTQENIDWAKNEKRIFLKQNLETRLVGLYIDAGTYREALTLINSLLRELKRLDDKMILTEVHLLESRVNHALANLATAKAALTSARTAANSIYCPPLLQAQLDLQSGVLHAEDKDYKTAYSYFFESLEGLSSQDDLRATAALKYMLMCKVMLNLPEDVASIISSKLAKKYAGPDVDAMKAIATAHENRSLEEYQEALKDHKSQLSDDPIIRNHLAALYDTLLEQNIVRVIEPYSRVEIAYVAEMVKQPVRDVESKLSQMILDKVFHGILDQGAGCLIVFGEPEEDKTYDATLETFKHKAIRPDAVRRHDVHLTPSPSAILPCLESGLRCRAAPASQPIKRDGSIGSTSSSNGANGNAVAASSSSPYVSYTYLPPSPPKSRSPSPYSPATSAAPGPGEQAARFRASAASAASAQHSASGMSIPLQRKASGGAQGSNGHLPQLQLHTAINGGNGPFSGHAIAEDGIYGSPVVDLSGSSLANGHHTAHMPSPASETTLVRAASPLTSSLPFGAQILHKAADLVKTPTSSRSLPTHASHTASSGSFTPSTITSAHLRRRSIAVAQVLAPSISTVRFVAYCALWYTSSAVSSNTGKSILNRFRYPVTLTFVQFGFVAGWCIIFCVGRTKLAQLGLRKDSSALPHMRSLSASQLYFSNAWGIKKPSKKALEGTVVMSLFQIAGHIFSSMAIARVPVSTVHTIKALSPLFTVLSYGLLFRVRYSYKTYTSLLPLTLGVMLACSFDLRANAVGFLCALGSTLVFVSQNIFSKKLLPKDSGAASHSLGSTGAGEKLDKLHLLLYSSGIAFLGMIPLWAYYDGGSLLRANTSGTPIRTASIPTLLLIFSLNGSVHFLQNLLAFSILSLTSPVTYSIASLIKRIAVICMAIVWFGQTIYAVQAVGISLTFFGLWMYNQAKGDVERGESVRTRAEKTRGALLPSTKEDVLGETVGGNMRGWGLIR